MQQFPSRAIINDLLYVKIFSESHKMTKLRAVKKYLDFYDFANNGFYSGDKVIK